MQVRFLSDAQLEQVHQASLEVLQRAGVTVPHPEVLRRCADHGAAVDWATQRVRLPAELVTWALGVCGKQFTIYGRDPQRVARFGQGCRNYNSIAGEASWLEQLGAPRRYASLADVASAARLGDALDGLTVVGAMADPQELPVGGRCVAVFAELLRHTTKPVTFWYHDRASARWLNELMIAVRGSRAAAAAQPLAYPFLEPISPLRLPFDGLDLLFETARLNLPVPIGPMAQMGFSAPATVAGTLVQENAEILAGLVCTQLIQPGLPVCYGGICHAFDMRTTQLIFSGPEQAIFGVALTQMGKHYGLPVYINVGLTDAKRPDAQAGLEVGITLALGAAAGADIFGHLGISGVDQAASLDLLVLQDEAIGYVESLLRETTFDAATLAVDEIVAAAGGSGTFIEREHTVQHFRRELWFPRLLDREYYQAWLDAGASSLERRCVDRRASLLHSHQPPPLDPALDAELTRLVVAARTECG
ncbi:MAG: trimethylamine methyltransferase family protein [Fimbriimonadaceae bacterium]|nr:trimethylamine methyltransferase family protein [Fimbriimonadaceae bacterium]